MLRISRSGNKQRLLDAYNRRFTGEVPFLEVYVAANVVEQVMERPMGGKHMLQLDAPDYVEFLQRTGMDAGYLLVPWPLGRKNVVDDAGMVHYVDGTIKSRADFDQIQVPSVDAVCRRVEDFLAAIEGTDLGCIFALNNPYKLAITAIGPMDSYIAFTDAPDFVIEFMDRIEDYTIRELEVVLEYPVDALFMTGPMCGNAGPLISPEMHERFIFPRVKKMMDVVRPRGLPVVLHVDGNPTLFMEWIVDTGFSAIHPIEPTGGFDIYDLKARYGDQICLCGNIDVGSVLSCGTPEGVREDTMQHLRRLAPGGGYVCGSSHDIGENIPFANFQALAETICAYTHSTLTGGVK